VAFESPAFLVKVMMDVDFAEGQAIMMAPAEYLDPQQLREFQLVLESRPIILLPAILGSPWQKVMRHGDSRD
jgi:hypothetical protein